MFGIEWIFFRLFWVFHGGSFTTISGIKFVLVYESVSTVREAVVTIIVRVIAGSVII
jgi:hypothetical protein